MSAIVPSELSPELISREALAQRWGVSKECIKRKERAGLIPGIRFNSRLLRYRLADVLRIEAEASSRKPPAQAVPFRNGGSHQASPRGDSQAEN